MDFTRLPVPPPWRASDDESTYVNDITGETINEHPLQRALAQKVTEDTMALIPAGVGPETKNEVDIIAPLSNKNAPNGRPFLEIDNKESNTTQLAPLDNNAAAQKLATKAARGKYTDYRCMWKEVGLFGDTNSYGLTLRYFEDGSTEIKFDGVDGMWVSTQLEGHYGPIERIDLFIGAKIKVFGRHLSINSTGASATQWIEEEGKRLSKQQNWLQERVESVGKVPVVRRPPPVGPLQFSGRSNKPAGSDNLRMLTMENAKLSEQLATLGLSHCVAPSFYTKEHKLHSLDSRTGTLKK